MANVKVPGLGFIDFPEGTPTEEMNTAIQDTYKKYRLSIPADSPHIASIETAAKKYGMDPDLALRLASIESNFNPAAVSKRGAQGLFQLMPATAKEFGVDAADPEQNIDGGIRYFQSLIAKNKGNVNAALADYNWGMGNRAKFGDEKMPPETRDYIRRASLLGDAQDPVLAVQGGQPTPAPTPPNAPLVGALGVVPEGRGGPAPVPVPSGSGTPDDPQVVDLQTPEKPTPFEPGNLKKTMASMMPSNLGGRVLAGITGSTERTGRALGLDKALRVIAPERFATQSGDETGELMRAYQKAGGGGETIGSLGADLATAVAGGVAGMATLPAKAQAAITAFAKESPKVAISLLGAVNSAVLTPGDAWDRIKAATISAVAGPVLHKALAVGAQPLKMSEAGEHFLAKTGDMPPVSLAAENPLVRASGGAARLLPLAAGRVAAGEERALRGGMREMFEGATPPGQTNPLKNIGPKDEIGPEVFQQLKIDTDAAYKAALGNTRIPVTKDSIDKMSKAADFDPSGSVQVHLAEMEQLGLLPKPGAFGGQSWHAARSELRQARNDFAGNTDAASSRIVDAYDKVIKQLDFMYKSNISPAKWKQISQIDDAYRNRITLENATTGGTSKLGDLKANDVLDSVISRTGTGSFARGQAPMQDIVQPLAKMESEAVGRNWNKTFRGVGQAANTGLALASMPFSGPAIPLTMAAAALPAVIGSGPRGASIMFGKTAPQEAVQDLIRRNPELFQQAVANVGFPSGRRD